MNGKQQKLLYVVATILGLVVVFPPYFREYKGNVLSSGFTFIADIPSRATMNVAMLFAEIVGVLAVGVVLYFAFRSKKEIIESD